MMIRAKAARMDMQEMSERVRKSMLLPLQWFSAATRRNRVPREQQRHLVSRRTTRPYLHPGPSAEGAEGSRPRFNEKSLFPEQLLRNRPARIRLFPTPRRVAGYADSASLIELERAPVHH